MTDSWGRKRLIVDTKRGAFLFEDEEGKPVKEISLEDLLEHSQASNEIMEKLRDVKFGSDEEPVEALAAPGEAQAEAEYNAFLDEQEAEQDALEGEADADAQAEAEYRDRVEEEEYAEQRYREEMSQPPEDHEEEHQNGHDEPGEDEPEERRPDE